jgi:thioredoxin-related protein
MHPKSLLTAVGALLMVLCLAAASAADKGIQWRDYAEGMAIGERDGKKIFLHFYADWCTVCERLGNTTFKDPAVVAYLNEHFVPIYVNSDENRKVAQRYFVRALPTTWFLTDTGQNISNLPGFVEATTLLNILKYVNSDSYRTMSFKAFMEQRS